MDGKVEKNQQEEEEQAWGFVKEETFSSDGHEFEWPGRNYCCNFCGREFKSAQALGGHMNVHRRDRARLRLLPSWMQLHDSYHNHNPNPNLSLSSFSFDHHHQKKAAASSKHIQHDDHEVLHVLKKNKKTSNLGNFEGPSNQNDLDLELHL